MGGGDGDGLQTGHGTMLRHVEGCLSVAAGSD